ncbi:MAG: PKD domain-containing protein, partial [Crocinitomicaceae bacterium]|nr:PKD domain-containing protein [Crocinitomicaceae bacterium]
GIDLSVYSSKSNFKYDFFVSANADPGQIQIEYEGLNGIHLSKGNLILTTSVGEFTELKPFAFQLINGKKKEVECSYILTGEQLGFSFPEGYDTNLELVIDPVLVAATLSSATSESYGHSATFDNDGNIYTGARNFGIGYPTTVGAFQTAFGGGGVDIAVSKISDDGTTLIYASYVGGTGSEYPHSMIVNGNGELFVLGTSSSTNYPITVGALDNTLGGTQDMVVTHFSGDATSLIGSTYVGGGNQDGSNSLSTNYGDNFRGEIILDQGGNCLVASCTQSTDFPTTVGAYQEDYGSGTQDGVVFCMPANLSSMLWSTYVGGTGHEVCFGLRMDDAGDVFVSGATDNGFLTGTGYQTSFQGGGSDGYVIKLTNDGSTIANSSYWGTAEDDYAFFLAIGVDDGVYLYGQSMGGTSPVTGGVYSDAGSAQFICKLDASLDNLEFATVIGSGSGNADFIPIAFMVDNCDYVYFSGHSGIGGQTTLPTTTGALQTTGGFYLGVLDPNATSMNYATHYGGMTDHVDGGTSRFDPAGIVYQGVCTNNGFNTTAGAVDQGYPAGSYDIGVFKIDFQVNPLYAQAAADPSLTGCAPFTVDFQNTSSGGTYVWDFGDGSPTVTDFEPTHTFDDPGEYNVMLIANDPLACNEYDTSYVTITVGSSISPVPDFTFDVDCGTQSVTCTNTGTAGVPLVWDMGDGTILTGSPVSHVYSSTGTFTVTLTAGDGICAPFASIDYDVSVSSAPVTPTFNDPTCYQFSDGSIVLNVAGGTSGVTFSITDENGDEMITGASNAANNLSAGWYYYFVDLGNGCTTEDSVELENPDELQAGLNLTHVACHGDATGIVVVDTVYNWQGSYNAISFYWAPNPCGIEGIGADSCDAYAAGDYVLVLNDGNGCSNTIDFTIIEPDPLVLTEFGTEPAFCRQFIYQSGNGVVFAAAGGGTPDYDYEWTNLSTGQTTNNTTWGGLNPATYQIVVTDENGCTLTETILLDSLNPIADYAMSSLDFDIEWEGTAPVTVYFDNQSLNYANPNNPNADTTFFWNFNYDNVNWVISHDVNESFDTTYTSAGNYTICLVALNKNGCSDTACTDIIIYDPWEFKPVNVFTPNEDGDNDVFTFENFAQSVETFSCVIVNRWGVVVAELMDIQDDWDGKDKNGSVCNDGVYFYTYEGTSYNVDSNGDKIRFEGQGNVTIIASP